MRGYFPLLALLAAGAIGVAAQFEVPGSGQIPSACSSKCGFSKTIEEQCGDEVAGLARRDLVKNDLVSCLNTICSQSIYTQMIDCVNCLVDNDVLGRRGGDQLLSTISSTCGQVGQKLTGTLTATGNGTALPTAPNPDKAASSISSAVASVTNSVGAQVTSAMSHAASHSSSAASAASSAATAATSSSAAGANAAKGAPLAQLGFAAAGLAAGALLL